MGAAGMGPHLRRVGGEPWALSAVLIWRQNKTQKALGQEQIPLAVSGSSETERELEVESPHLYSHI